MARTGGQRQQLREWRDNRFAERVARKADNRYLRAVAGPPPPRRPSWHARVRQETRQARQSVTWRQRVSLSRLAIVRAGRSAGQAAHRVAAQGFTRAKLTGAKLAGHVVAIQKAAGLDQRLMRESARSVAYRPMQRASDRAWQAAYSAEAGKRVDASIVPAAAPQRPAWPYASPKDPEAGG